MILAKIPFINTAPYFHFLSSRWLERHRIVLGNPRQLGDLARAGKVDAGLFSLVDAWELIDAGEFEWLGSLGIASRGPIQSILLTGTTDPASLAGQAIGISPQTATTVRLLEIWLKQRHGVVNARFSGPEDNAAARLFIGDEALRRRLSHADSEPQIDLAEQWTLWTGLPFVFARWAVRKNLPERDKRELALTLLSAIELAIDDPENVAEREAERSGLPAEAIQRYLAGITYRLGAQEEQGAAEFRAKMSLL